MVRNDFYVCKNNDEINKILNFINRIEFNRGYFRFELTLPLDFRELVDNIKNDIYTNYTKKLEIAYSDGSGKMEILGYEERKDNPNVIDLIITCCNREIADRFDKIEKKKIELAEKKAEEKRKEREMIAKMSPMQRSIYYLLNNNKCTQEERAEFLDGITINEDGSVSGFMKGATLDENGNIIGLEMIDESILNTTPLYEIVDKYIYPPREMSGFDIINKYGIPHPNYMMEFKWLEPDEVNERARKAGLAPLVEASEAELFTIIDLCRRGNRLIKRVYLREEAERNNKK